MPETARLGRQTAVPRPYNLYFTPDGNEAVVMSEQHNQIRFSDPRTFKLIAHVVPRVVVDPIMLTSRPMASTSW